MLLACSLVCFDCDGCCEREIRRSGSPSPTWPSGCHKSTPDPSSPTVGPTLTPNTFHTLCPYDSKHSLVLRLLHSTGSEWFACTIVSCAYPTGVLQTRLSKEDVLSLLRQHLAANSLFLPSSRHERRHVAGHEQADATVANGRNAGGLGGFAKGSILRQVCR